MVMAYFGFLLLFVRLRLRKTSRKFAVVIRDGQSKTTGSPNTNCRFLFGSYLNMHTISVEWKHDFSTIPMYIFSCYVKKFINSTIRVKLGLITFWWKFQVFLELWYFLQLFWGIFLINLFWKLNFIFFCFPCYSKW